MRNYGRKADLRHSCKQREVLNSNPKIEPDPRGAPGYLRYEGAGLEMIYNPKTGQVGHIQPVKAK
jgi:filamentous hemagglutinin